MKKLIIVLTLCLFYTSTVSAQHLQVVNKPYEGYNMYVIRPTIENFIYLLNCTESQFIQEMKYYKYFEFEGSAGGRKIDYWNGSLNNFAFAKAINIFSYYIISNRIEFYGWSEYMYPADAITDIYRSLKPYYLGSGRNQNGNMVDLFSLVKNGITYECCICLYGNLCHKIPPSKELRRTKQL